MRYALIVLVFCGVCETLPAAPGRWEEEIRRFEVADQTSPPEPGGILFVGSSSIRSWDTDRFFPGMGVINRGFGGSQLEDLVHFFDRVITPYRPRVIVLYAGDNDLAAGKTPQHVLEDLRALVRRLREALPEARLIALAVKPSVARWSLAEAIRRTNESIRDEARLDPRLEFVDIFTPMLSADGAPRADLLAHDGLHLNEAGYTLWTSLVRPHLAGTRHQLWITNAFGDDVHVYEVGTWKLVKRFPVGPQPHGIAATADGRTVFIAVENFQAPNGELAWVDPATFTVTHRLPVGPLPNEIECTPDGRWVYVPCADGTWWVVDAAERKVVKRIRTGGRPHNTVARPDGRRMYLSPMGAPRRVTVVDVPAGHEVIGEIVFDHPTRPPAISGDGRRLLQNTDHLLGFQVADIAAGRVIRTVAHDYPSETAKPTRCHGLAVRPDQQEVWCCDVERQILHVHEAVSGRYEQTHAIEMPGRIYWVGFSPDSRYGFVSVRSAGKVAVIDARTKQTITLLEAGDTPKRTQVITVRD